MASPRPARPVSRRLFLGQLSLGAASLALASRARAQNASASAAQPRKLGIALCGLGSYAKGQLAPSLLQTKNCYLAGVVTGTPAKGPQWAKEYGFPEKNIWSYDTMHQIADNKDIDIIYVVTPNGLHMRDAVAAAKAGKHVIVEKPMCNTVAECDAILAACRANKVKCSVGYRLHFDPYHQELMRLARDRDFGQLNQQLGDRGFVINEWRWRIDKKLAGGGPMMDIGIYILHGACMASGGVAPVAVTAQEIPKTRPDLFKEGVEEGMRWTMEFPGGERAEMFTSYRHSSDRFRAEGDKGWIEFKQKAFTYAGAVVETSKGPLKLTIPVKQQALQMDDFALCVREGRESRVAGEMGRRDLAIIEAVYQSARTGKRTLVKV